MIVIFLSWFLVTVIVGATFIWTIRTKMYLYFIDHWKKLVSQAMGMILFILLIIGHMTHDMVHHYERNKFHETHTTDNEEFLIYYAGEILASLIVAFARVTDDLFFELNREKTTAFVYSVFQYDYLEGLDPDDIKKINVNNLR